MFLQRSFAVAFRYGAKVVQIISAISKLRATAGGGKDQGIVTSLTKSNIVPSESLPHDDFTGTLRTVCGLPADAVSPNSIFCSPIYNIASNAL